MLQRIFLLTAVLLLVSVLAQETATDNKDGESQSDGSQRETTSLEDQQRPRGERADDELPPPRRQRQ